MSTSENSSGENSDNYNEEIQFGTLDINEFNYRVNMGTKFCTCVEPVDSKSALGLLLEFMENIIVVDNINCLINSIISVCNYFLTNHPDLNDPYRLAFADLFYKMRHELLFKLVLLSLNAPNAQSDVPFSQFGIESKRTPDYIKVDQNEMVILEIAATSNYEKTAMMKGSQNEGYESKYLPEILELRAKGFIVNYVTLIFDMSVFNVESYLNEFESLKEYFFVNNYFLSYLNLMYKEMCTLTYNMKSYLYPTSTLLFNEIIPIEENHHDLNFLYSRGKFDYDYTYKKFTVSSQVYNKISNIWHRVLTIYENCNRDFKGKYIAVLSITNNRLTFEEDINGWNFEEIRDLIITNDKPDFFQRLQLKVGNTKFPAIGSETGVEFIERVNKKKIEVDEEYNIPFILSHVRIKVKRSFKGKIKKYKKILSDLSNKEYASIHFDPNYEDLLLKKIKEDDYDNTGGTLDSDLYKVDKGLGLLQENELSKVNIIEKMAEIKRIYYNNNSFNESVPIKIKKMKQSFILPIANLSSLDYCPLDEKNEVLFNFVYQNIEGNEFTKTILLKILDENFTFTNKSVQPSQRYMECKKDKFDLSNKMSQLYKKAIKNLDKSDRLNFKLSDCKDEDISNEYKNIRRDLSNLDKNLNRIAKEEGVKTSIELIRLPTKNKKSILGSYFQKETEHFKSKTNKVQSTIEGFGIPDNSDNEAEIIKGKINSIGELLSDFRGNNPDMLIDINTYDDVNLLRELKDKTLKSYNNLIEDVKNSYLGHSSAFISRLGHSLMFYSQMPFNSDYIRADNLGYNNVLLLIRGGKKIFKSKSSKMFRLLFPVSKLLAEFYVDQSVADSSYIQLNHDGSDYLLSPWMMLHESILTDSISFYPRVMSFVILNSANNQPFKQQIHNYLLNVLLAFHNRRQSEVFLANMRYILLSTMGDFTGIMGIFEDFCGFNYDKFQFYIRSCIFSGYADFFKKMRLVQQDNRSSETKFKELHIKNIFTGKVLENTDSLTLMIYSTFLMTKGPYQRPAERAINLSGMLSIHEQFDNEVGLKKNPFDQLESISVTMNDGKNFDDYCKELFSSDFKIDPKYIASMGVFANSYFEQIKMKDKFQVEWIKILNSEWDSMATSTGLRGRPEDVEDFWGKKGYFVVYKFLLKSPGYVENIKILTSSDLDDASKSKLLRTLNETFLEKINLNKEKNLLFHAVDKVQWRGSREIFVMDLDTKLMQQPIEKMFAFLCKNIDNELISIPSDKRAQVIHHTIFEKDLPLKDVLTWFLTLDCSKWAPKSMFIKFAIMLLNMPVLPGSFVTHFLNYTQKLFFKKIYFNNAEVEVLKNNIKYKEIINKHLIHDDVLNGYYMEMPYSWVMGIFNYTSSFMHAFNQKYAAYLINKSSTQNFSEETTMVMFAHSDDSGGRISSINSNLISRGLMLYEVQLKCCNHLLSKKKSVVSRIYFEILSIIYLFKKLLALLPKFLGGIRFTPTDKGPAHDMLQSYSKCIEVIVSGADFAISYLVMKFYSMMVWRFYYNRNVLSMDYKRPLQLFGMPDAHPLMVILTGSDSDFLRIYSTGGSKLLVVLYEMMNELNLNLDDEGLIRPLKFNIKVRNIQKGFDDYLELLNDDIKSWTLGNVNFRKSPFNALNFLKKLNDPGFIGSLVNETPVRRISRSYYLRKGESVITKKGNYFLLDIMNAIRITSEFLLKDTGVDLSFITELLSSDYIDKLNVLIDSDPEENSMIIVMKNILSGPIKLNSYFNKLTLENKDFRKISRTLKPTQLQLLKTGSSFSVNFDASQLVSYIKEPKYRWALPDLKNLPTAEKELMKLLDYLKLDINCLDESSLLKLTRMHVNKTYKDIYLYSQIPGEIRTIKTYAAMLVFLSSNSFKDVEISGLTLKLKNTLTDPGYIDSSINEDIYYLNTLFSIILMLMKGKYNLQLLDLTVKPIDFINWSGGSMYELIDFLYEKKNILADFAFIRLFINYIKARIEAFDDVSSIILKDTCFYVFIKEQKRRGGWYGTGQLMINAVNKFFILNILGSNIVSVESNYKGKIDPTTVAFIIETCTSCGINTAANYFQNNNKIKTDFAFGYDHVNELSVTEKREISKGVPYFFLKRNPIFMNQLDYGKIEHIRENLFIYSTEINNEKKSYKVYGLKINKTNVGEVIQNLFNKKDFEKIMIEEGIDNLQEFIITELLTEFNEDIFITKEEVFDLIFSSEAYKIFSTVKEHNSHYLPKIIKTAKIPAEEGSFPRIMLAYSEQTGIDLIKNYKNYDPVILSIRSEFPEGFSLILSEKLVESHKKLFSPDEDKEIINAYLEISKIEDPELLKSKLISLMCYWGYGSLVNSINIYDVKKKKSNYSVVRIKNIKDVPATFFRNLFNKMVPSIIEAMLKFANLYDSLEFDVKGLNDKLSLVSVVKDFLKFIALSCYNYKYPINYFDLANLYFINTLFGYLKVPEFCETLTALFSKIVPLNTLPIDYNYRHEFISLFNTLKVIYFIVNNQEYDLDFISIVDRMPANITEPINFLRDFDKDLISNNEMIYHHGFINNFMIDKFKSTIKIKSGNKIYHIKQRITKLSETEVFTLPILSLIRPLNEEFLESETWDEINQECSFEDIDEDTINELWDEKDMDPYVPKETRFKKDKVNMILNWVIYPYIEGKKNLSQNLRQIGENVAIVSNAIFDIKGIPNSYKFLTNFSSLAGGSMPDVIVYVFGNKALKKQFWCDLLGENIINLQPEQLEPLFIKDINTEAGISNSNTMGALTSESLLTEDISSLSQKIEEMNKESDVINVDKSEEKIETVKNEINEKIKQAVSKNLIDEKVAQRLKEKYDSMNKVQGTSMEDILSSLLEEIDINMLNNVFEKTLNFELTKQQVVKIYQTPEHFGLAQRSDTPDKNPLLNAKLRAELDSFCTGLSSKLASGSLTISKSIVKLVKSSFKIWKAFVLSTNYKKENKKFLLKLMNSIINSAFAVDDDEDNNIWYTLINNVQVLIAQDEEDDDSDDETYIQFDYNISQSSRLKYRFSGF